MAWGYYAYLIGDDGHINNRVQILCNNDEEAIRCARRLVETSSVELWQEKRKVATFQPDAVRSNRECR
jgi:hypothetical protein